MEQGFGFAHFLVQTDEVGKFVLLVLLGLSMASWFLIITRSITNYRFQQRANTFLSSFRQVRHFSDLQTLVRSSTLDCAFARLAQKTVEVHENARQSGNDLDFAGGMAEYLTRTLNSEIDQEAANVEYGLTVLASAGSASPYIGLFGTVWGIYHALVQIGMSGQGTLDKVAGPVGEALIMTALGLAVAIPAVLSYNALNRRNRVWLLRLEKTAHDLYVMATVDTMHSSARGQ